MCLNFPPRLKHVATLPCEISMSAKCCQSEICIVINDKSQGSIAKHLRCNELLYHLSLGLLVVEFLKLVNSEYLAKLQAKWLITSCAPFALRFCPQRC